MLLEGSISSRCGQICSGSFETQKIESSPRSHPVGQNKGGKKIVKLKPSFKKGKLVFSQRIVLHYWCTNGSTHMLLNHSLDGSD